jgi:hypothetical protein
VCGGGGRGDGIASWPLCVFLRVGACGYMLCSALSVRAVCAPHAALTPTPHPHWRPSRWLFRVVPAGDERQALDPFPHPCLWLVADVCAQPDSRFASVFGEKARFEMFRARWVGEHGTAARKETGFDAERTLLTPGPTWSSAEPVPWKVVRPVQAPPPPASPVKSPHRSRRL